MIFIQNNKQYMINFLADRMLIFYLTFKLRLKLLQLFSASPFLFIKFSLSITSKIKCRTAKHKQLNHVKNQYKNMF